MKEHRAKEAAVGEETLPTSLFTRKQDSNRPFSQGGDCALLQAERRLIKEHRAKEAAVREAARCEAAAAAEMGIELEPEPARLEVPLLLLD